MEGMMERLLGKKRMSRNEERHLDEIGRKLGAWVENGGFTETGKSMSEIAEEVGATQAEITRYCRVRLGKRFVSWKKELRVRAAAEMMLQHPELPLNQVGTNIGIEDKTDFRNQFRSVFGCSPAEFRKKNLEI